MLYPFKISFCASKNIVGGTTQLYGIKLGVMLILKYKYKIFRHLLIVVGFSLASRYSSYSCKECYHTIKKMAIKFTKKQNFFDKVIKQKNLED